MRFLLALIANQGSVCVIISLSIVRMISGLVRVGAMRKLEI